MTDEYDFAACRWPVLAGDVFRGPPPPRCELRFRVKIMRSGPQNERFSS
jgi:hypothetical protein